MTPRERAKPIVAVLAIYHSKGPLSEEFFALARDVESAIADARRETIESVFSTIRSHWPAIICDEKTHTDRAQCSCCSYEPPVMPTVGSALETWIDHIRALSASGERTGGSK